MKKTRTSAPRPPPPRAAPKKKTYTKLSDRELKQAAGGTPHAHRHLAGVKYE